MPKMPNLNERERRVLENLGKLPKKQRRNVSLAPKSAVAISDARKRSAKMQKNTSSPPPGVSKDAKRVRARKVYEDTPEGNVKRRRGI